MDIIKGVLIFVFLIITLSVSAEEDHSDEHHEDAFENILKTLKLNNSSGLRFQNLTTLLTKLGVHDCSNKTNHHHKCVTASSLFGFYNISTADIVNETDFGEIAAVIIYTLLRNEEHSDEEHSDKEHPDEEHSADEEPDEHGTKFVTQKVDVYKELLKRYQTSGLCEQILDQMLRDVNESIGKQLDASKCFSMHEVFHDQNISTEAVITKEIFSHISTIIVSKLLDGHCIELEHKTPLPCPSFFVSKLFEKYASNDVVNKEKIEELLKNLKIAGKHSSNDKKETDHDHDHRRRRSLPVNTIALTTNLKAERFGTGRYRREADDHHDDDHDDDDNHTKSKYEKCYSADQLFAIYHADQKTGFKVEKFKSLSSALLYEIDSSVCVSGTHDEHSDDDELADKYVWGYGIVAVAIISLCSVLGVAFIPFMTKVLYQKAIVFFISLAVGTLTGDALLHLMPHATGFHDTDSHNHGSSDSSSKEEEDRSYLWKFLVAVAGIYGFFLFESITHLFLRKSIGRSCSVEHTRGHSQFGNDHHLDNRPEVGAESNPQNGNQPVVLMNVAALGESGSIEKTEKHSSSVFNSEEKTEAKKTVTSVAWMIIIGDTIHNIADGIAIGVAFTDSTFGGISTSIAVFCHELPHELGDFAVLISAGMSVKKALLANFLSACSCFIGLVFGILIGEIKDVNLWIFAVTAGFFLYIALTDMLPELMHSSEFSGVAKTSIFFLQNAGMLTGFGIMILLAYYEEDIRI